MIPGAERTRKWRSLHPSVRPVGRPRKHEATEPPCLRFVLPVHVYAGHQKEAVIIPADDEPGVVCSAIVWVSNGKPAPGVDASILERANRSAELIESHKPNALNWIENPMRRPKKVYRERKTPANVPLGPCGRREDITTELCRSMLATGMSARQVAEKLACSRRLVCSRLKEGTETEVKI